MHHPGSLTARSSAKKTRRRTPRREGLSQFDGADDAEEQSEEDEDEDIGGLESVEATESRKPVEGTGEAASPVQEMSMDGEQSLPGGGREHGVNWEHEGSRWRKEEAVVGEQSERNLGRQAVCQKDAVHDGSEGQIGKKRPGQDVNIAHESGCFIGPEVAKY